MRGDGRYMVLTSVGEIELTKGAYLSLMRKKGRDSKTKKINRKHTESKDNLASTSTNPYQTHPN